MLAGGLLLVLLGILQVSGLWRVLIRSIQEVARGLSATNLGDNGMN
jgi:hypothetical protein